MAITLNVPKGLRIAPAVRRAGQQYRSEDGLVDFDKLQVDADAPGVYTITFLAKVRFILFLYLLPSR